MTSASVKSRNPHSLCGKQFGACVFRCITQLLNDEHCQFKSTRQGRRSLICFASFAINTMAVNFRHILASTMLLHCASSLIHISDIQSDAGFIWLPNPDESGSFYPTALTPPPDADEHADVFSSITVTNKEAAIRLYLYNREDPDKPHEIIVSADGFSLPSNYEPHAPVKILVHGFLASAQTPFPDNVRKAYVNLDHDVNVIVVDWSILAKKRTAFHNVENIQSYHKVLLNIVHVGHKIAQMINFLVKENVAELNKIHFIGHGLGAHVATAMAESLHIGKIGRVTGLNPSRAGFKPSGEFKKYRLHSGVAQFVDVIHTNYGKKDTGGFSLYSALGHADFYPNGGVVQPGCDGVLISSAKCRQARSRLYWKESITTKVGFRGCKCESWNEYDNGECSCKVSEKALMGEHCPPSTRGKFFLRTNSEAPFAKPVHDQDEEVVEAK